MKKISVLLFFFFPIGICLQANSFEGKEKFKSDSIPKGYVCYRTIDTIKIDGKLDEGSWKAVPWTDDFVDIEGDLRSKPRFRTHVKMLWDEEYFYIGAELEDPDVWATLTKRDTVIFMDNDFEIFIDPDGDNHEYYEIEINALNTVWDLLLKKPYRDGGPAIDIWDILDLKTAIHVDGTINNPKDRDKGWSVEIAIPWKSIAEYAHRLVPPIEGDQWRINFSRVEWQHELIGGNYRKVKDVSENNWVWSPQGVIDMHRPEMWGYVQFTKSKTGIVYFKPDEAATAKKILIQIYYAQSNYFKKWKKYTSSLKDLDLQQISIEHFVDKPVVELNKDGYSVTLKIELSNGIFETWHIRQDSKIWKE